MAESPEVFSTAIYPPPHRNGQCFVPLHISRKWIAKPEGLVCYYKKYGLYRGRLSLLSWCKYCSQSLYSEENVWICMRTTSHQSSLLIEECLWGTDRWEQMEESWEEIQACVNFPLISLGFFEKQSLVPILLTYVCTLVRLTWLHEVILDLHACKQDQFFSFQYLTRSAN